MITIIIIIVTCLISITAFGKSELMYKLQLNPYQVIHRKQWYRLLSHGFLHADWVHLLVNMFVLYVIGTAVENFLKELQASGVIKYPNINYLLLYFGGIILATLTTLKKHKDNHWYNSVGASGAVSAIIFTYIFFAPLKKLYLYGIIGIPGILFGIFYLIYSHYMSRKGKDNINHDAHFIGAVFGFIFPVIMNFRLISYFFDQIMNR